MAFFVIGGNFKYDEVPDRKLGQILNSSYRETLETHRDEVLPGHYEEGADAKYNYVIRNRDYTKRKFQLFGHSKSLVFTGKMRKATRLSIVTATRTKGQLIIRPGHAIRPQQREEIEATTPREEQAMANQFRDLFVAGINNPANQKKKRGGSRR